MFCIVPWHWTTLSYCFFLWIVLFISLVLYCVCLWCTYCYPNWGFSVPFLSCQSITCKDKAQPALPKLVLNFLIIIYVLFSVFCVLFVCKCVLYCCHWVSTQLQLNIYHIISPSYHIIYNICVCVCVYITLNSFSNKKTNSVLRTAPFLVITQWVVVIPYRHLVPSSTARFLTCKNVTSRLSRNIGKELLLLIAQ
jgi:hypothetical protein